MRVLAAFTVVLTVLAAAAHAADVPQQPAATPYPGPANAIGSAANGCLAGASALPLTGTGWQVMKPSRNRFWGHPELLSFLTDLGRRYHETGTFLIGDMAQPRGGRMRTGHASHQTGIDVDLMYRAGAPGERFEDAENVLQPSVLMPSAELDPNLWGAPQERLLRLIAGDSRVERVFVNPVVKRSLCRTQGDHAWLRKLRPWWGHDEHLHVRLVCPEGDGDCLPGAPIPPGDGCGEEVESWIRSGAWNGRPPVPAHPAPPPVPPAACAAILGGR